MKTHPDNESGKPRNFEGLRQGIARLLLLFAALFTAGMARAQSFTPVITQVLAAEDNSSYFDHDGDLPAVIFIKNNGTATGTISNYSLTDNTAIPRKWIIPTGVGGVPLTITAGDTLIVFASAKNHLTSPLATNFLLPCTSTCYLYNPQTSLLSQKTVSSENCPECIDLITVNSTPAYLIPSANNPPSTGTDWRLPAFSDSSWPRGQPCLGYDSDPLLTNMILYATFDSVDVNTGTRVITDVSGPTLHNGTWPASAAAPNIGIPITSPAVVNQSVQFYGPNNVNSYASYAHHAELNPATASYTFGIWVRPLNSDPQAGEVLFRKGGTATTDPGYMLTRQQLNGARFRVQTSTTNYDVGFPNVLSANQWTHIMVVIERVTGTVPVNQARIYRNGTQMSLVNFPAATSVASVAQPLVQAQGSGALAMFQGFQDDFITWGRALTPAEITFVYNAGAAGKRADDPSAPGSQAPIYGPCIQTNVQTAMKGVNTSLYERINFAITAPSLVKSMTFKVKYDDGFIAYINGVEIARRNAPTGAPAWNSAAASDRLDSLALASEDIPVPQAALAALVAGSTNVLAIHALNFTANDQRFLICPDLCYVVTGPEDCIVSTNGKLFWITFPGNAPEEISNPLQLSVCITGVAGTIGNVAVPGIVPPFSQNFILPAGGKIEIALPKAASLEKSDTIEPKGVRITALANVAVIGKTRIDYSTDTFLAHPIKCLGSSYLTLCWGNTSVYSDLNGTQFGIVATADNTHVTVKPKVTTGSHAAGVAYNFILNAGQTYLLRNTALATGDLTGSEITSDSPVAVFGGHRCANIAGTFFFCDTVLEQTLPVAFWNTEFALAPLATRTGTELVRVVAAENTTTISINGAAQAGTLNKGDKKDYNVSGGAVLTSAKKFLATHLSRSSDSDAVVNADPFQLNCQPTASWFPGYRFCTPPAAEFSSFYINVIAKNAELAGVTITPAPVATGAITAIGATAYSYRQVTLAAGTTYTTSGRTHGLENYGWGEYDSYGHSGGMSFTDTQPPVFAQCPPDLTLFTTGGVAGQTAVLPDLAAQFGVSDACCPQQSLVIVQTPSPGSQLNAGDYQVVISVTDCNNNTITCVVSVHVRTDPRAAAFPTQYGNPALEATIWGWHANPDGDCYDNEQEYALGTNMAVGSLNGGAFSFSLVTRFGQEGVEVSYRKRNDDPSLEYSPEGSGDLVGWFSGLGHFEQTSATPDSLPGFTRIRAFSQDSPDFHHFFLRMNIRRN